MSTAFTTVNGLFRGERIRQQIAGRETAARIVEIKRSSQV
jgi:hypothetical protein